MPRMNNADAMLQNKPGKPAGMPGFIRIGNRRQQLLLLEQTCFLFDVHFFRCMYASYRIFILKNSMMARHESNESVAQL